MLNGIVNFVRSSVQAVAQHPGKTLVGAGTILGLGAVLYVESTRRTQVQQLNEMLMAAAKEEREKLLQMQKDLAAGTKTTDEILAQYMNGKTQSPRQVEAATRQGPTPGNRLR